jgi:spermidine synthase
LPLRLKTEQFFKDLQTKLKPEGLVVFNLNRHRATDADVAAIRATYPQVYLFNVLEGNLVVVATTVATRETPASLRLKAREADRQFRTTFSFQELLNRMGH